MSDHQDRPTTAEMYARATGATDLSTGKSDGVRVAIDYLGAAAWSGNDLGHALFRLRSEYEEVHASHVAAERALKERQAVVAKLRKAKNPKLDAQARAIEELAVADATAARALILLKLKTLSQAKELLGRHAVRQATKRKFWKPDADVLRLAGRALDVWLDDLCRRCNGTGKYGGYSGEPHSICKECGGTGKRVHSVGKDDQERQFGQFLLAEMDRVVSDFDAGMRHGLRKKAAD